MMMFSCLTALRRRPDAHAILRGSEEYPELSQKLRVMLPDENFRRVGQSMAAASLPEV